MYVVNQDGERPEPFVAAEDVCAWPNLTRLPNGDIVALIYNQPSHGRMPGDVECWASEDEGETWAKRSVAAPRGTPQQNRMNVAAGLTAEDDLILITSGWSAPGDSDAWANIGEVLPTWVCISKDGGRTWDIDKESFPQGPDGRHLIPFGDIMAGEDGKLRVAAYRGKVREDEQPPKEDSELARRAADGQNWVVRGDGDGRTWEEDSLVPVSAKNPRHRNAFNETALLHLGDGEWIAAARYGSGSTFIVRSEDDGATWSGDRRVARGHPAHLMRLDDGTIILTYGKRGGQDKGVEIMFSDDEGRTWSDAFRVLDTKPGHTDVGYPSSVQRVDGLVVTAYYEGGGGEYSLGVVIWDPVKTRAR